MAGPCSGPPEGPCHMDPWQASHLRPSWRVPLVLPVAVSSVRLGHSRDFGGTVWEMSSVVIHNYVVQPLAAYYSFVSMLMTER